MLNKKWFVLFPVGVMLCGCQDEEFGFSYEEIHQTVVEREYIKAFNAEFPEIDPNHTWMCTPDTIYEEVQPTGITRAHDGAVPSVYSENIFENMSYTDVQKALDYMKEAEDNRGKCAQDFEYKAIEDGGDGFETYTITPTFWGRKFCDNNSVGIYYIGSDGKMYDDLPVFWTDRQNKIKVHFKDGHVADLTNSPQPITDDPTEAWNQTIPLTHSCSKCGGDGRNGDQRCSTCNGSGKAEVDHYELPQYTIKVPVGMKWGVYLRTQKQQNHSEMINWYSNSQYNELNNDGSNTRVKAAATFTYNGTTYVSFEDAPTVCSNTSGTGECSKCRRGHYDHDYNDIVLTITPRPVESTYRSIKYRVMCEDLGGTFDWDFNDVVFDVIYEDGKQQSDKAKVYVLVQAVGGTLPIYIAYIGTRDRSLDKTQTELHALLSDQTDPNNKGLYTPVNVATSEYETIMNKPGQKILEFTLSKQKYSDSELDVRDYVKEISVKAYQNGLDKGATSDVKFPDVESNAVPQCFMTSTGTEWADELQKITLKYPRFTSWVASQKAGIEWWNSDPNF